MSPIIKNVLAVFLGWLVGSAVNMGLVQSGHHFFPITGTDLSDLAALAEVMPTLGPEHFIFPFLGHALGTLAGAIIAGILAASNKMKFSLLVGFLFLLGGLAINYMLPGPIWFTVLDLVMAYLPMAWLGGRIALKLSEENNPTY